MFESLRGEKDLDFVEAIFGQRHNYWVRHAWRLPGFWKGECLDGTNTSTLVETCHHVGPRVIKTNQNNVSQTCTIYASGFVVDTSATDPSIYFFFWNEATTRLHRLSKDWISQQQWPWLAPSGPPVRNVSSVTPTHRFHTALIFDKQNCNSLLMYVGCFFLFLFYKRNVWNFVEIQRCPSLTFQHWPRYCIFFLTREIKLVIIYCHDVNDEYDHLFTHCKRCPPACLCVHERSNDSMSEQCDEDDHDIGSVCHFHNVECFLSTRDSWIVCACECVFMCALTLEWLFAPVTGADNVNLTACFWRKWCVYDTFAFLIVWKLWYLKSSKTLALLHMSLKFFLVFFLSSCLFSAKCNKKVWVLRRSSQLKAFQLRCQILPLPSWAGTVFYRHIKDITCYVLPRFCYVSI